MPSHTRQAMKVEQAMKISIARRARVLTNVGVSAFARDFFPRTLVFFVSEITIQALAFFTIFYLIWVATDTTTITFVPIAARIVVSRYEFENCLTGMRATL